MTFRRWVKVRRLAVGTKVVAKKEMIDCDDDDNERVTLPGEIGVVTSVDERGGYVTYGIEFERGGWLFLDEDEFPEWVKVVVEHQHHALIRRLVAALRAAREQLRVGGANCPEGAGVAN